MEQQNPKKFRASVISQKPDSMIPNKLLVPDHKLYFASLDNHDEAHYLCAFLNSSPVKTWLGGFLHGKQIATTIFEFMHVPKFNPDNKDFVALAEISKKQHLARRGTINKKTLGPQIEKELESLVQKICS